MKLPTRLLIVFVLAAVLLSACSVGGRNALLGKWTPEKVVQGQPALIQEYTIGGKYRWEIASGVLAEATYQFEDDSTYVLKLPEGTGMATRLKFVVEGDKLTLTPLDLQAGQAATPETLVRVK